MKSNIVLADYDTGSSTAYGTGKELTRWGSFKSQRPVVDADSSSVLYVIIPSDSLSCGHVTLSSFESFVPPTSLEMVDDLYLHIPPKKVQTMRAKVISRERATFKSRLLDEILEDVS